MIKLDIEKDFTFFRLTSVPLIKSNEPQRIIQLFQMLVQENNKNEKERFDLIPKYLIILFSEIKHQTQANNNLSQNASTFITQHYKNALSELICEKKTVKEFADYLAISANHLHKCVKATTGKSAHELLEEMRILEAQVMLKQTNLSIGEIAYKIGKFDPSDFSRFFKNKVKNTPLAYRNKSI